MLKRELQLAIACFWLFVTALCVAAEPQVDLELVLEPGVALTAPSEWMAMVKDLGFSNLKVRNGQRGDTAEIRKGGSEQRPIYSVRGIVTTENILRLPGGNIRFGDKTNLKNWKAKLQDGGSEGVTAEKVMYGLTAKQMLQLHDELKTPVPFATRGEKSSAILHKMADLLHVKLDAEGAATEAVTSNDSVLDEYQSFALGTALAGVLRPLGCVLVPEKKLGSEVRLVIRESKEVEKPWPIGWDAKTAPVKLAPKYYETLNTEISDFVLSDALSAIQKRVQLPMLFDHNNLLKQKIQIDQVKVSSKKARRTYASVVDEILYQAKLKGEIRIDEAEQPFLWITTLKQ